MLDVQTGPAQRERQTLNLQLPTSNEGETQTLTAGGSAPLISLDVQRWTFKPSLPSPSTRHDFKIATAFAPAYTTGINMDLRIQCESPAHTRALMDICGAVAQAGGRAYLVGGSVRDALLGLAAKDLDLECFGLPADLLIRTLQQRHEIDVVGRAFGVIKLRGLPIDVSLPRRESKTATGHRGFAVHCDSAMSLPDAARRRDFTINAILFDPLARTLHDPFDGLSDLQDHRLRHTSEQFAEDPLRVLRGMQFAARFQLHATPDTLALCRRIEPEDLSPERVFEEWRKLILLGLRPSLGLTFLRETGWLRHFPELAALVDCPQDPAWHPEGDVWTHTLHALDAFAAARVGNATEDLVVGLAVLCHDFGKPSTTRFERGRLRSPGHDRAGAELTQVFLQRLTRQQDLINAVVGLVADHMTPDALFQSQATQGAIGRLARRVGRIDRLVRVARADRAGRPPQTGTDYPAGDWLLTQATALGMEAKRPRPLVQGRHLIELGLTPGPRFTPLLQACLEAQLDGKFRTVAEGVEFARALLDQEDNPREADPT